MKFVGVDLQPGRGEPVHEGRPRPSQDRPLEREDREIVRSATGVGAVVSETFLAEVGDAARFRSAKKLVAYLGLAPGQRESAGKRHNLHIEKKGSRLMRALLVQAAWQAVRQVDETTRTTPILSLSGPFPNGQAR